jgi:hypothetical protein
VRDDLIALAQEADILVHHVADLGYLERHGWAGAALDRMAGLHTDVTQVGGVAERAGVGELILSHYLPAEPGAISEQDWATRAGLRFSGRTTAGRDGDGGRWPDPGRSDPGQRHGGTGRAQMPPRSASTSSRPAWASRCHRVIKTMHPRTSDLRASTVTDSRITREYGFGDQKLCDLIPLLTQRVRCSLERGAHSRRSVCRAKREARPAARAELGDRRGR